MNSSVLEAQNFNNEQIELININFIINLLTAIIYDILLGVGANIKTMKIVLQIIGAVALVAGLALLMAFPTMWLWNWLMPDIFGLVEIDFWQALGLNVLSGILIRPTTTNSKS